MNLGIDMDGVLIDNGPTWGEHFNLMLAAHGHSRPAMDDPQTWSEYPDICPECFRFCCADPHLLWRARIKPGAGPALAYLARAFDLYLITHRSPELEITIKAKLQVEGLSHFFTGYEVGFDNKRATCERLNCVAMLDDGPHNVAALEGTSCIPVIFDAPYNRDVPGPRVRDWADAAEKLHPLEPLEWEWC